jgi:hypothetical protein
MARFGTSKRSSVLSAGLPAQIEVVMNSEDGLGDPRHPNKMPAC